MNGVTLVIHTTDEPALFAAAAAATVAIEGGAGVWWSDAAFPPGTHCDAVQHVLYDGMLAPSGLVWAERLIGQAARRLGLRDVPPAEAVIAVHPGWGTDNDPEALTSRLAGAGLTVKSVTVHGKDGALIDDTGRTLAWRDRYGRVLPERYDDPAGPTLSIGLAGTPEQMMHACPAPLAALGDALEAARQGAALRFLDPTDLSARPLDGLDGVLMPGGVDMAPVEGQIRLADLARAAGLPMLGLCLGMQSMATAAARRLPGWTGASLAEARPDAPCFSFQPMPGGEHRLGPRRIAARPDTRLARLMGGPGDVMANHRYRLAPSLIDGLRGAGLDVCAIEPCGTAAAVEGPGFHIGLQGHPELSSRRGAPHPVFSGFVAAMAGRQLRKTSVWHSAVAGFSYRTTVTSAS